MNEINKKESDKTIKEIKINADPEFIEVLDILEEKIKGIMWDGMDRISKRTLTRILARKIKSSKIL